MTEWTNAAIRVDGGDWMPIQNWDVAPDPVASATIARVETKCSLEASISTEESRCLEDMIRAAVVEAGRKRLHILNSIVRKLWHVRRNCGPGGAVLEMTDSTTL